MADRFIKIEFFKEDGRKLFKNSKPEDDAVFRHFAEGSIALIKENLSDFETVAEMHNYKVIYHG